MRKKCLTRQSSGTAQKRAAPYFYVGHMNNSFSFLIIKSSKPLLVWFAIFICLLHASQCSFFLYNHFFNSLIAWTALINFALAISLFKLKKITVTLSLLNLIAVIGIFAYYSFSINPETLTIDYYKWALSDKTALPALVEASVKKIFTIWLFIYSILLNKRAYLS